MKATTDQLIQIAEKIFNMQQAWGGTFRNIGTIAADVRLRTYLETPHIADVARLPADAIQREIYAGMMYAVGVLKVPVPEDHSIFQKRTVEL